MKSSEFSRGVRDGIPIGLGYLSVSFAFGIQAILLGLTPLQALLISMTNLTSAGQLAGLQVMAASGPLFEMALSQLVINLRYALMSLTLTQKFDKRMGRGKRMLAAFGNTDEIFAVSASQTQPVTGAYFAGLVTLPYIGWASGTLLGALGGQLLPAALTSALGLALYGMFLAVIIPPSKKHKNVLAVVVGAALCSCALAHFVPALSGGMRIIVCAVALAALGALVFPVEDHQEKEENA